MKPLRAFFTSSSFDSLLRRLFAALSRSLPREEQTLQWISRLFRLSLQSFRGELILPFDLLLTIPTGVSLDASTSRQLRDTINCLPREDQRTQFLHQLDILESRGKANQLTEMTLQNLLSRGDAFLKAMESLDDSDKTPSPDLPAKRVCVSPRKSGFCCSICHGNETDRFDHFPGFFARCYRLPTEGE